MDLRKRQWWGAANRNCPSRLYDKTTISAVCWVCQQAILWLDVYSELQKHHRFQVVHRHPVTFHRFFRQHHDRMTFLRTRLIMLPLCSSCSFICFASQAYLMLSLHKLRKLAPLITFTRYNNFHLSSSITLLNIVCKYIALMDKELFIAL